MSWRRAGWGVLLILPMACAKTPVEPSPVDAVDVKTPADPLTAADLDAFLAVVRQRDGGMIPEFTPPEDEKEIETNLPARTLAARYRAQFRKLFDADRQGLVWSRDAQWSQALAERRIVPAEFAGLVRSVSCAIMRVRLEARVDTSQLVANARDDVAGAVRTIEEIDAIPAKKRSVDAESKRTMAAVRLARATALLEFAEMVSSVPAENVALVRKYAKSLKPLLPAGSTDELLAELEELATGSADEIQQARYEEPATRAASRERARVDSGETSPRRR